MGTTQKKNKEKQNLKRGGARFGDLAHARTKSAGFTVIELIVGVAIMVIIASVATLGLSRYRNKQDLDMTLKELEAIAQATQKRSISQEDGKAWGIRFGNPLGSYDYYEVWSGLSFDSGTVDKTYGLRRNVIWGNPGSSSTIDMLFPAVSGKPAASQVISIINSSPAGILGDLIINKSGLVVSRLENGIVGYWHFDENASTTAYDASGNGNNGTLISSPTWQTGSSCKAGGCLSFDGVNNYVDMPTDLLFGTGNFSYSVWLKPLQLNTLQNVMGKSTNWNDERWDIRQNADNQFELLIFDAGVVQSPKSSTFAQIGEWVYLVSVREGDVSRLYVNGVLEASTTGISTLSFSGSYPLTTGRSSFSASDFLNGIIDEIRIYNRALSASEVLNLYNDLR